MCISQVFWMMNDLVIGYVIGNLITLKIYISIFCIYFKFILLRHFDIDFYYGMLILLIHKHSRSIHLLIFQCLPYMPLFVLLLFSLYYYGSVE